MALNLPATSKDVSDRAKVDVRRELGTSEPFLARSYLGAIVTGISNRIYEFFLSIADAELEVTPLRATRNLQSWATGFDVSPIPGERAVGEIWINASGSGLSETVPDLTVYVASDGTEYQQQGSALLVATAISVSGITRSGTTATATTTSSHGIASNAIVTISNANQAGYNLSLTEIIVTGEDTFTYEVDVGTVTPSTGTVSATIFGAPATIRADDAGTAGNLPLNSELSRAVGQADVETIVQVGAVGIIDGTDDEDDEAMRVRLIDSLQNPIAHFNDGEIESVAKTVSGVTRVFVQDATPANGQTTVYFMRDLDAESAIPTATDEANVFAALDNIRPAPMAPADLIVSGPTAAPVGGQDFDITALSPDTPSMRTAIEENLIDYFREVPLVATDVTEDAYRAIIFNSLDTTTGDRVVSYTLTQTGAITVTTGEIAQLGSVTFP